MIKSYNYRFYPNPFRQQKSKLINDQYEAFNNVREKLKPFLTDKFYEIHTYLDEFGELKPEIRILRSLRERIQLKMTLIKNKVTSKWYYKSTKFITDPLVKKFDQINTFENYQQNLRYLELPVQPLVNNKGFEIQTISSELIESAIEEVEDGFSYIYEYCSNSFPDSIEMWNDYALLNTNAFPHIAHDDLLESTYEIFDKIFDDLQKNSVNLFNWVISGDLNSRLLKIIKPRIQLTKINYLFKVLESLLSVILLLLIIKYVTSKFTTFYKLNEKKLSPIRVQKLLRSFQKELTFKKARFDYKLRKVVSKIEQLKLNNKLKYKILKLILHS